MPRINRQPLSEITFAPFILVFSNIAARETQNSAPLQTASRSSFITSNTTCLRSSILYIIELIIVVVSYFSATLRVRVFKCQGIMLLFRPLRWANLPGASLDKTFLSVINGLTPYCNKNLLRPQQSRPSRKPVETSRQNFVTINFKL